MRKPATKAVCLAVILLLFAAGLTWFALLHPFHSPTRSTTTPDASVTFLGYTNDTSGTLLARFSITNLSDFAVGRSPKCLFCVATAGSGWTPHSGALLPNGRLLGVGASEIVAIKPPTTQLPWKASFYVSNDVGPGWAGKRLINTALHLIGRHGPYGAATRQVDSERIESQK
jgi:hypothetical protein